MTTEPTEYLETGEYRGPRSVEEWNRWARKKGVPRWTWQDVWLAPTDHKGR
jgi:hypothetical protein